MQVSFTVYVARKGAVVEARVIKRFSDRFIWRALSESGGGIGVCYLAEEGLTFVRFIKELDAFRVACAL